MAGYPEVIFFSLIGGVFSLIGGVLLLSHKKTALGLARFSTPFAAGALLGAAFFDLLPESIEALAEGAATRWALGGVVLFFLLEHFLHWFHHHHEHEAKDASPAPLVIIGDSIHNLLDGVAIGAAFLISTPTGIVAAIAVAAHEIPQEIGDFGLLLKYGYTKKRVLLINAASALMSTLGAVVTFWVGTEASLPVGELLAITAGMFIYIAASDLIPTIHEKSKAKVGHLAVALLLLGIVVVGVAAEIAHEYIDPGHEHSEVEGVEHHDEEPGHSNEQEQDHEETEHDSPH